MLKIKKETLVVTATTELDIIAEAINEYETKTCIRFVLRSDQIDYVYIEKTGAG